MKEKVDIDNVVLLLERVLKDNKLTIGVKTFRREDIGEVSATFVGRLSNKTIISVLKELNSSLKKLRVKYEIKIFSGSTEPKDNWITIKFDRQSVKLV